MMNRRQFVYASAAGAALLGRVPGAHAATYDLIIKGGRVIDPSVGLDAARDVAIVQGKIAAVRQIFRVMPPRRSICAERSSRRA
jgi:dihydroorotase